MDILKIVSVAISALIIIMLLRKFNNDYAVAVLCFIGVLINLFSFGILIPVFSYIKDLESVSESIGIYSLMLKSVGIFMMCSFASELCRDSGEASLASKIEFAGKCTLLAFCLPLIEKVLENATKFIS